MTAVSNLNLSVELTVTPSRKRKRQFEKQEQQRLDLAFKTAAAVPSSSSCFTNAAFSSTPKKILAKRRLHGVGGSSTTNKENTQTQFAATNGLEVKSIADIVKNNIAEAGQQAPLNPYEVTRKPPKKKKKAAEEAVCFENAALNLDLPEKQFNPFEIVRDDNPNVNSNCFVNAALNLKTKDVPASRNPFEIQRPSGGSPSVCGLKIGLPFKPTVDCRIDFNNISMSQLTPSKLFADKLVFSPAVKGKASVGSVGETTMDIGKELDRYQLELENSINEAKLRKNVNNMEQTNNVSPVGFTSLQINVVQTVKISQKLTEIKETEELEETGEEEETVKVKSKYAEITEESKPPVDKEEELEGGTNPFINEGIECKDVAESHECVGNVNPFACNEDENLSEEKNLDELYAYAGGDEHDEACFTPDDSFDFKAPAPFVRAYTKPPTSPKLSVRKDYESEEHPNSANHEEHAKKSLNVKSIIRKSFRKLMPSHNNKHEENALENEDKLENDKHSVGLFSTIRQSLRRKQPRTLLKNETIDSNDCELSIIDGSERTMRFKTNLAQTEEYLTNAKKNNMRNSIRRTTREMSHHLMKSVFHKAHEEYDFGK